MRDDKAELISSEGRTATVVCTHQIEVDTAYALYEFVVRGHGLTVVPEHFALKAVERGDLVHVLPDWSLKPLEFHAVWPDRSRRESLTLAFVRFLAEHANRL